MTFTSLISLYFSSICQSNKVTFDTNTSFWKCYPVVFHSGPSDTLKSRNELLIFCQNLWWSSCEFITVQAGILSPVTTWSNTHDAFIKDFLDNMNHKGQWSDHDTHLQTLIKNICQTAQDQMAESIRWTVSVRSCEIIASVLLPVSYSFITE